MQTKHWCWRPAWCAAHRSGQAWKNPRATGWGYSWKEDTPAAGSASGRGVSLHSSAPWPWSEACGFVCRGQHSGRSLWPRKGDSLPDLQSVAITDLICCDHYVKRGPGSWSGLASEVPRPFPRELASAPREREESVRHTPPSVGLLRCCAVRGPSSPRRSLESVYKQTPQSIVGWSDVGFSMSEGSRHRPQNPSAWPRASECRLSQARALLLSQCWEGGRLPTGQSRCGLG